MSNKKYYVNNVWDKEEFRRCALGKKFKMQEILKYLKRCIKWSCQRIVRGYAECDVWNMDGYLQRLVPDMLQDLKDNRNGSPSYLGEIYTNEEGILVNDTCHDEWDKILDNMIFLWRESNEETCKRINPYYDEYDKAFEEFTEKYGILGDKLSTEAELENDKKFRVRTGHFMDELYKLLNYKSNYKYLTIVYSIFIIVFIKIMRKKYLGKEDVIWYL